MYLEGSCVLQNLKVSAMAQDVLTSQGEVVTPLLYPNPARERANFRPIRLMLLASSVGTPIHKQVLFACVLASSVDGT